MRDGLPMVVEGDGGSDLEQVSEAYSGIMVAV